MPLEKDGGDEPDAGRPDVLGGARPGHGQCHRFHEARFVWGATRVPPVPWVLLVPWGLCTDPPKFSRPHGMPAGCGVSIGRSPNIDAGPCIVTRSPPHMAIRGIESARTPPMPHLWREVNLWWMRSRGSTVT